jgi:hypothetical protein
VVGTKAKVSLMFQTNFHDLKLYAWPWPWPWTWHWLDFEWIENVIYELSQYLLTSDQRWLGIDRPCE